MSRYVPGTYRPLANKDNDYLIDRAAQKAGRTFSGVEGIAHAGRLAAGEHGPDLSTARRRTSSPPTTASSWRAIA